MKTGSALTGRQKTMADQNQKPITRILIEVVDEICDNYCKYPAMMLSENQEEEADMLEDMLYEQYCANCPLTKLI